MPVIIPDETLQQAGLTEREVVIELACRLYHIGRLPLWPAARLAGVSRIEFEHELTRRQLPIHRPTLEDLAEDLVALDRLRDRS